MRLRDFQPVDNSKTVIVGRKPCSGTGSDPRRCAGRVGLAVALNGSRRGNGPAGGTIGVCLEVKPGPFGGNQLIPVVEAERDRGSRQRQAPRVTLARNMSTARLKTSGSSRLAVWPGARQDGQAGGGDGPLEHQGGLQAALVLVADQHQDRNAHLGQLVAERVQGGPSGLDAAHGQGAAQRGMTGQRCGELGPAARVLVLELDPGRPDRVPFGDLRRALGRERGRGEHGLGAEGVGALGLGAVAGAGDHRRADPVRVPEHEVQRGEAAHGQADHVRLADVQAIEYRDGVGDRALLRVRGRVGGHA